MGHFPKRWLRNNPENNPENLFLGYFEANALENALFKPHDDIFMIWTEGLDNLKIFIDYRLLCNLFVICFVFVGFL